MATSKGGTKMAAKKKTTSIRKGPTVRKALTASAKAVTRKAKKVVMAAKKKSSMIRLAKKKTLVKKKG
jgi:hypothetical protein